MSEQFLHLDATEQKDILTTLATELGRKANVLEKDVWVCWALDKLIPGQTMLDELEKDYLGMRGMIYGDVPEFSAIIESLTALEKDINSQF